jgi:hypothetical protein
MKIAYFPNQTALQSEPVWRAFLEGIKRLGHTPVENDKNADAAVIWSVLWHGRLRSNLAVYQHYRKQNKPVFIIEVGALHRGRTWKIAVNNITQSGIYAETSDIDFLRAKKLDIELRPINETRSNRILIAAQHQHSLQWEYQTTVSRWVQDQVVAVRSLTDMPIVVRPHPRFQIANFSKDQVTFEVPNKLANTYDMFDIEYDYHCVINYNSGVGIQSAIHGTPVITDISSLASSVSSKISEIGNCQLPDRTQWFQEILHTEWLVEEIAQGIPQERLIKELTL